MSVYQHDDVVDTEAGVTRSSVRSRRFSPGQVLSGALGIALTIFGIVVVTRSGIDASLNDPADKVLGFKQSSYVGLFEIFTGLVLLLGATSLAYRAAAGFAGALLVVAGVVVAAGNLRILLEVGAERSSGWALVVLGAIALVAAMMPTRVESTRVVESDELR